MLHLPPEVEKLLLDPPQVGKFVPDPYDVEISDVIKPWRRAERADVGLLGVPYDTSVVIRRGCRFGPVSVRRALVHSYTYDPGLDIDLSEGLDVVDFGDVDVVHTDVQATHERVERVLTAIHRLGVTPIMIGGDHSLSFPAIKALANVVDGHIGVINIDAHLDLRISHHGEISSGTPFRRALEELGGKVRGRNLVEIGINGWHNTRFYMSYAHEQGVRIISAREVHRRGIDDVIAEALERAADGTEAIYLSVDIDALDIPWAPGTCSPGVGGLTSYQVLEAVYQIGRHPKTRAFDLVEVAEPLDVRDVTSVVGAQIVMHMLGASKARLGRQPVRHEPWRDREAASAADD